MIPQVVWGHSGGSNFYIEINREKSFKSSQTPFRNTKTYVKGKVVQIKVDQIMSPGRRMGHKGLGV